MGKLKSIIKDLSGFSAVDRYFRRRHTGFAEGERYARGHFYSPLPDLEEVEKREVALFNRDVDLSPSIDIKEKEQLALLEQLAGYYADFTWSKIPRPGERFHLDQDWFCEGDALSLYGLLRLYQPRRVVEVGSGFSSALMLDTSEQFLDHGVSFTFIDPFPDRLLSVLNAEDTKRCAILRKAVQDVSLDVFRELDAGDMLFIDSSHVSRIGSDVNFLLFQILPLLKPGVLVHFHDIFWPFEYPRAWVMGKRAWNEAYILRAFLQYNENFSVLLFNSYAEYAFGEFVRQNMPLFLEDSGGSLWLVKNDAAVGAGDSGK